MVAAVFKVFAAGGERVEVGDLVGGVHVAVCGPERHRQRVVVGGGVAAVASDEAHRRSAVALTGEVQEVADDHAEVVQIPVQRLEVLGGLQHDVAEPLDRGGLAGRALRGVGARRRGRSCRCAALAAAAAGERAARDDADRDAARVDEIDGDAADGLGQRRAVVPVASASRSTSTSSRALNAVPTNRDRRPAKDHTRRAGVGAAQVQLVGGAQRGREAEGARERLGAVQVGLLELQPGDVLHLDDWIAGRPGCSPLRAPCSLCRSLWAPTGRLILASSQMTDEIVTYDAILSQVVLTKSSKVMAIHLC